MSTPGPECADDTEPPSSTRPRFSARVTLLYTLLVAALIGLHVWPWPASPLLTLDRPEESLERVASRELDLQAALWRAPGWERALHEFLAGSGHALEESIAAYEELAEALDAPRADIYRHILLAESGRPRQEPPTLASADWMSAAYGKAPLEPDAGRAAIVEIRERLPETWFADTLVARIAARIGDGPGQAQAESAIADRGAVLLGRARLLGAAQGLLLALGLAGLVSVLSRRPAPPVGQAPLPPDWPLGDGYALFSRGIAGLLGIGLAAGFLLPDESPLLPLAGVASGIPLLWWTTRYLRETGASPAAAFGLGITRGAGGRLLSVTCLTVGLGIAGDGAITAVARALGLHTHWADGFPEDILWDPGWRLVVNTLDGGLWTPVVEEVAFRGLLYGTLRSAMPVTLATLVSATIFAAAHGYGLAGFTSALWSGIVWAATYERTRSLLPGMLAHAVNNLLVTVTYLALYRLG